MMSEQDPRIKDITDWYNNTLSQFKGNKDEFNKRFTSKDGDIDISSPDIAVNYGKLEREGEILEELYSKLLVNEIKIEYLPEDNANIDKF